MKNAWRILRINLAVLIGYSIWARIVTGGDKRGIAWLSMILIMLHVVINMTVGAVYYAIGNKEKGRDFMFSTLCVMVIGFGVCWGNASI